MDNKTYLDTLLALNKINTTKSYFWTMYDKLGQCSVSIRDIMNIGIKHPTTIDDTLYILFKIIKKCMDIEVIDDSFKEVYKLLRVYDLYMIDINYVKMIKDISFIVDSIGETFGPSTLHIRFLRYRVKVIHAYVGLVKINNKKVSLNACMVENDECFRLKGKEENYSMILDYDGEHIFYKKKIGESKREAIKKLDKDKINLIITFWDSESDDLYKELR